MPKTAKSKKESGKDYVQRMAWFDGVVDGDKEEYDRVKGSILAYRKTAGQLIAKMFVSRLAIVDDQDGKKEQARKESARREFMAAVHNGVVSTTPEYGLREWFLGSSRYLRDTRTGEPIPWGRAGDAQPANSEVIPYSSNVWDVAKNDIMAKWTAKDPDLGASRNWLAERAVRGTITFENEGIPILRTPDRPNYVRLIKEGAGNDERLIVELIVYSKAPPIRIVVKGNFQIKDEQRYKKLDYGASSKFHKMWLHQQWNEERAKGSKAPAPKGALEFRDAKLHLTREGGIKVCVSYRQPILQVPELDQNKTMEVAFDPKNPFEAEDAPETLVTLSISSGGNRWDRFKPENLSVRAQWEQLRRLQSYLGKVTREKKSYPKRRFAPGGAQRASLQDRTERVCTHRDNYVKNSNHHLSKCIATCAATWKCGNIVVKNLPQGNRPSGDEVNPAFGMLGMQWNWSAFKNMLAEKAKALGISVSFEDPKPIEIAGPSTKENAPAPKKSKFRHKGIQHQNEHA